jgi:molecular chaperone GrpE (heat shock protein)
MQILMQATVFVVLTTAAQAADVMEQTTVTPVQKVIQLMNGMLEKGKSEKNAEQVQFAAYKQWCDDTQREKSAAIREATEQIEVLKADIQMYAADAEELQKQIAKAEEDITVWMVT